MRPGSGFDDRLSAGPFAASAGVQTDKAADALKEFFNELNAIRKPVPAMGQAAVRTLLEEIGGTPAPHSEFVFMPELVVRGSSAKPGA